MMIESVKHGMALNAAAHDNIPLPAHWDTEEARQYIEYMRRWPLSRDDERFVMRAEANQIAVAEEEAFRRL